MRELRILRKHTKSTTLALAALLAVSALAPLSSMTALAAEEVGPGVKPQTAATAITQLGIDLEKLDAAQQADQLVLVVGSGMDSAQIQVEYLTKNEDGTWTEQFLTDGYCGYNGMSTDKQEGDRRTPVGTYQITRNFGILPDPGSVLPYKQVDGNDFWVDDPQSQYYNQMVSVTEVAADWRSAEPLAQVDPQYRYALALNYNTEERIPGKGSAIFLHGLHPWKTWTEGCISIPEEQVKLLVQQLGENARIVILPGLPEAELE